MEESRLKADPAGTKVRDGHGPAPEGAVPRTRPEGSPADQGPRPGPKGSPNAGFRVEKDLLGEMRIPAGELRGIHTFRALGNFRLTGRPTHPALIRAYLLVKKTCALANAETGWLDREIAEAICAAADEGVASIDALQGGEGTVPAPIKAADFYLDALQGSAGTVPAPIKAADFYLDALQGGAGTVPAPIKAADFYLDALQGGAGTSTNMNVNEVLASRAAEILRRRNGELAVGVTPGEGHGKPSRPAPRRVEALSHVNLHQSTNDTYPTALRVALIALVRESAGAAARLQGALQEKEREFARVITVGRTELQGAVPMTLGSIFSAMAEAAGRDRWRTFKCEERLRVVNLGGTAVGTGLTAPRKYVFRAGEILRELTGFPLARAENLVDATANADPLAEVAGIVAARGANLVKAARDLRQLAAFGDIELPAVQAGSSIMPGKVNPVILEAVMQGGMKARSECALVCEAAGEGSLQINEFLPLMADSLLSAVDLVTNASALLARHVEGIRANGAACAAAVNGNPIIAAAFLPMLGYGGVEALVKEWEGARAGAAAGKAAGTGENFREWLSNRLGRELVERVLSPEALSAVGHGERPGAPSVKEKP